MPDLDCIPSTYASWVNGMTGVCHHAQLLLVEMGSLDFLPGPASNSILWIFACQVAKIIDVSHHT
jgi:hypothetical protein